MLRENEKIRHKTQQQKFFPTRKREKNSIIKFVISKCGRVFKKSHIKFYYWRNFHLIPPLNKKTFFSDEFLGVIVYFAPLYNFMSFDTKNVSDNYLRQFQQHHLKMLIRQFKIITQHLMGRKKHTISSQKI